MNVIISILVTLANIVFKITDLFKKRGGVDYDKIDRDKDLAEAIREGKGRRVAEEFKRRKQYTK